MIQVHPADFPMAVLGVPGRLLRRVSCADRPSLWLAQEWTSLRRHCLGGGFLSASLRFDDRDDEGANRFAMTGRFRRADGLDDEPGRWSMFDVVAMFPELASLGMWQGCRVEPIVAADALALMMSAFRVDMEYIGFLWVPPT